MKQPSFVDAGVNDGYIFGVFNEPYCLVKRNCVHYKTCKEIVTIAWVHAVIFINIKNSQTLNYTYPFLVSVVQPLHRLRTIHMQKRYTTHRKRERFAVLFLPCTTDSETFVKSGTLIIRQLKTLVWMRIWLWSVL